MYRSSGWAPVIMGGEQFIAKEENSKLPLETLYLHMAHEFCDLANICSKVETAVGDMINCPEKKMDQPIITIQGLDRLRQSLEDMPRLSTILGQQKKTVPNGAGLAEEGLADKIRNTLILSGLVERLIQTKPLTNYADESGREEYWG